MGVKEDIELLKSIHTSTSLNSMRFNFINDNRFSKPTRNVLSSLFSPHADYLGQKFYYLQNDQIKIVTDILELMED